MDVSVDISTSGMLVENEKFWVFFNTVGVKCYIVFLISISLIISEHLFTGLLTIFFLFCECLFMFLFNFSIELFAFSY